MSTFASDCLVRKTVLVTGASSGIGRALAVQAAQLGAKLIISGRDANRLQQTRDLLLGNEHALSVFDLQDADLTAEWVKGLVTEHGQLHGIFHAAGGELVRPMRLTKSEQLAQIFGPGLFAGFGIARAATQKGVLSDGASVVFMSSVAASRGQAGMTAYSSAKAAIDGLIRSLSCELAQRKIRVNSIAAGAVATEMHERLVGTLGQDGVAEYERKHLLGFGKPDDVVLSALFLLSDASRWITGTALVVDGGYMVR